MKFIALLVLVLVGVWFFRSRQGHVSSDTPAAQSEQPQDMVRCAQCGVHLPGSEVVKGIRGSYCCQDHLRQSEH